MVGRGPGVNHGGGRTGRRSKVGGTLIFGRGGDSAGLDPAFETRQFVHDLRQRLRSARALADESTKLVPGLATSWDVAEDGLTYTSTAQGGQFHDGTDMNADAVVFSSDG